MKLKPEQLADIRERHEGSISQEVPEWMLSNVDDWVRTLLGAYNECRQDREQCLAHITALEAEIKDADSYHNGEHLKDAHRINALEGALKKLARLGNGPHLGNSEGNVIAQQALLSKQEQES